MTKIGRTGVKFGKAVGQVALAAGMGMATGIASYSVMSPFYVAVAPVGRPITFEGNRLVVGPDGDHVYALHIPTNDVTIMKTATGEELDKVAVGGGAYGIFLAPGGKFVYTCTSEDISLIDTKTNKVHLKHHVSEGKIIAMQVDDANDRIYALTTQSIVVLDVREGKLLGIIEGVSQLQWLALPQMSTESQS